jgi:Fur family transcriptional regulator, ferric uptake regulator
VSRTHSAAPIADAPDLEAALATLRSHGMRASAARRLVLEALYLAGEPVTVEDIAGGLDGRLPASDPGSVYRNLEALEAIGLVRHVHVGHAPGRYVTASAGVREHLLCDACGALRAVDPEALDDVRALIRERFGHEARFTHFPIGGLCAACARPGSGPRAVPDDGEREPHAHP